MWEFERKVKQRMRRTVSGKIKKEVTFKVMPKRFMPCVMSLQRAKNVTWTVNYTNTAKLST